MRKVMPITRPPHPPAHPPAPPLSTTGRDLPQRTMSRARHDRFPNTTNLRGAHLGVSITPGKELAMTEEIDHRAILARVEQIIDLLRTCHVREGSISR